MKPTITLTQIINKQGVHKDVLFTHVTKLLNFKDRMNYEMQKVYCLFILLFQQQ